MEQPGGPAPAGLSGVGLSAADVGRRVVVRHRLSDGRATDVLGYLDSLDRNTLVVRRPDGGSVSVAAETILAAKRVPPGPVRVRTALPADAAAIESLRVATWRSAYRGMVPDAYLDAMAVDDSRLLERLTAPPSGVRELVADTAGAIVGWAVGGPSRDGAPAGEIYACYVDAGWWGSGVGSRLLRRVVDGLIADGRGDITLRVLADNERARRFYARHGFAPDGRRAQLDLGAPVIEERWVRRPAPPT